MENIVVWGVKEDHDKSEYVVSSESFATQAEADAFRKGLAASYSGEFCGAMHFDNRENAALKAQDMNAPQPE